MRTSGIWLLRAALFAVIASFLSCGGPSEKKSAPFSLGGVQVEKAEPKRIVVVWTTSEPSRGEIRYGTDRARLDRHITTNAMTTVHRVAVDGLDGGTTYYYQVTARSAKGESSTSGVNEVSTPAAEDSTALSEEAGYGGYDVGIITTRFGDIVIRFHEMEAPRHTDNFKKLAREGFYDGTTFHRVIPSFIIQGGDPLSKDGDRSNDGTGGPGYTLPAEIYYPLHRGSVVAARQPDAVNPGRRSSGSQFFICVAPLRKLDGKYTVFAEVVRGNNIVSKIANTPADKRGNPLTPVPMQVRIQHVGPRELP